MSTFDLTAREALIVKEGLSLIVNEMQKLGTDEINPDYYAEASALLWRFTV